MPKMAEVALFVRNRGFREKTGKRQKHNIRGEIVIAKVTAQCGRCCF
jgi:ribosomal protein S6E (S10)